MEKILKKKSVSLPLGEMPKAEGTFHILVIRLSAMGDVAMVVPVLRCLVQQYPSVKITVLTKAFFTPIFKDIPNVTVVTADVKGKHKGLLGLWRLAREIKMLKPDAVADLHNVLRTKILRFFFFLFGIKSASVDKGRAQKKELTKLEKKHIVPLVTTHERYAKVFQEIGFSLDLSQKVELPKHSIPKKIQEKVGNSVKKWIGIAPFAAHQPKMYPIDLMEKVIVALDESEQYQLFLFGGGKAENALLNNLASKYENAISVVGILDFDEELALISNLDVMLSMDSGNGHLAALFNIPVITIWGATHPFAGFAPFQQPKENQVLPDLKKYPFLPTSIYGNKEVEGYEGVMQSISSEKIIAAIKKVL